MNKHARSHWKQVEEYLKTVSSEDMKPMEEWLKEYPKKSVVRHYRRLFTYWLFYTKKTPKQLVEEFDNKTVKNQILQYQTHLLDHYAQNTSRTMVQIVRAFYTSQCEPVRGLKRKIVKTQLPKQEHTFTVEDLKAIHEIANSEDKAILSLACSLGYHAKAFLSIERTFIENLIARAKSQKEDFISWFGQRSKTQAYRLSVLTPIAIHNLERYLNQTEPSEKLFNINEDTLNKRLQKLVQDSGIVTTGKVSFKLLRKWLMQTLNDSGLTEFETKLILGKAIGTADLTYLQTLQKSAFEKYKKAYPMHLSLSANVNGMAKFNQTTDLAVKMVEAFENLRNHMKQQGIMKDVNADLEQQWNTLFEYSQILKKKNGEKHEGNEDRKEEKA